jgi:hypothetical protein
MIDSSATRHRHADGEPAPSEDRGRHDDLGAIGVSIFRSPGIIGAGSCLHRGSGRAASIGRTALARATDCPFHHCSRVHAEGLHLPGAIDISQQNIDGRFALLESCLCHIIGGDHLSAPGRGEDIRVPFRPFILNEGTKLCEQREIRTALNSLRTNVSKPSFNNRCGIHPCSLPKAIMVARHTKCHPPVAWLSAFHDYAVARYSVTWEGTVYWLAKLRLWRLGHCSLTH